MQVPDAASMSFHSASADSASFVMPADACVTRNMREAPPEPGPRIGEGVELLQQQRTEAARGRPIGCRQPDRAAADHDDVEVGA